MYVQRDPRDRLGFGDIVEARWLFNVYLREDAGLLRRVNDKKTYTVTPPPDAEERADRPGNADFVLGSTDSHEFALAHGDQRRAIVLTDDCQLEKVFGREGHRPRGRILLAAIREADDAAAVAVGERRFEQFGLRALDDVPSGVVEFEGAFMVDVRAFTSKDENLHWARLASLDPRSQRRLSQKWAAYSTRHGPYVVAVEAEKLSKLMIANGDAAVAAELNEQDEKKRLKLEPEMAAIPTSIRELSSQMWTLEGFVLDGIADAWANTELPGEHPGLMIDALARVRLAADNALMTLGASSWNPGTKDAIEQPEAPAESHPETDSDF